MDTPNEMPSDLKYAIKSLIVGRKCVVWDFGADVLFLSIESWKLKVKVKKNLCGKVG